MGNSCCHDTLLSDFKEEAKALGYIEPLTWSGRHLMLLCMLQMCNYGSSWVGWTCASVKTYIDISTCEGFDDCLPITNLVGIKNMSVLGGCHHKVSHFRPSICLQLLVHFFHDIFGC